MLRILKKEMGRREIKALIVESDASRANRIAALLTRSSEMRFHCASANSLARANQLLLEKDWNIVISGLELVDAKGLDSLVSFNPTRSDVPVVSIVEGAEPDAVLNAVRSLSDDCLFWGELGEDCLVQSISYALERRRMLRELQVQRTEQEASHADSLYRGVLDKIDEAVFVVSRVDGILLYSNETARRWFGANMGEALEDVLEYDLLEVEEVEMEISTRNSNYPRAELRSLTVDWGKEAACLITMRDISKQKRAEGAFLASQRRLDLSTREAGFWSWDPASGSVRFSDALRKTLGHDSRVFSDSFSTFENAIHPEDRERTMADLRGFAREQKSDFELKFRIRCGDGLYANVGVRGGQIAVGDSKPFVLGGSLFRLNDKREIYVPTPSEEVRPAEPAPKNKEPDKKDLSEGGVALIVDDEEVLRKALDSILTSYGFTTIVANDGVEGIDLYEKHQGEIEIVVLDMNMPRVDGSKVFERIRKDGDRIPIIMTSGNDDKQALPFKDGEKENCDFLLKPFGLADVKRIVDRFVSKPVAVK